MLLGMFAVFAIALTATSVAAWREIDRVVDAFEEGGDLPPGLEKILATADEGEPQTIMLIGSDKRAKTAQDGSAGTGARSDTIILVRLDPSEEATALLSIPRDLKVRIPGYGTDKINAAYSIGGPELTLRTVKAVTGLSINHVVNINFEGFRKAVGALGCVYADIDRRYFNDNTGYGPDYATIDIKQGYQKLCGRDSLDYVRFRHDDTDIVRAARQQEFLRQTKQQIGVTKLFERREELIKIFGENTQSDIRGRATVIGLMKLAIASAQHPFREIHFKGSLGASYVTASDQVMKDLAADFLGLKASSGPRGKPRRVRNPGKDNEPTGFGLENAETEGKDQALQLVAQGQKFPVFYPRLRVQRAIYAGPPRYYKIPVGKRGKDREWYPSYRMVIKRDLLGEYYGIQGTTWKDAPIFREASETRKIGKREYELHYDGDRLRMVAWETDRAKYYVQNTLLQSLSEKQMLSIAKSARTL